VTPEENARFEAIERRLDALETQLAEFLAQTYRPVPPPIAPPPVIPPPFVRPPVVPPPMAGVPEAPPAAAPRPPRDLETAVGLTWVSRIAVLTIVLALAFFFKYAFENHWITEWGRIALGLGAGAVAIFFGERFWRTGQQTYGQSLTAAGIVFLYLSCWAAFGLYGLVSQPVAFVSMILVTAGGGALAFRYGSQAVALLALAGGFATPLLLGAARVPWLVFGYALILDLGAAFAGHRRRWRWPEALAAAGTVVIYATQLPAPAESRLIFTFFVFAFYAVFAASRLLAVWMIAQIMAGMGIACAWQGGGTALAAAVVLAGAGLAAADRRDWATAVSTTFAGFWLAFGTWSAYAGEPPPFGPAFAAVTAAFLLFLSWAVWRTLERGLSLRLQDLVVLALNAAFYFGAAYTLLYPGYRAAEGLFAVVVGAVHMGVARVIRGRDARGALLAGGAAWVLLILAAPIQFAGYYVTMAWALEAAAITWIGVRFQDGRVVNGALAVFLLVLGSLLVTDSRAYGGAGFRLLANVRFLTFLVASACLLAAARWIAAGRRALVTYLSGLGVLLWGLCLEAVDWARHTAAPADFVSVASTSISVLAAAYAVLLVAGGVARRSAVTRIAGIALIGLVVLKLYLYDVWLLAQFYRMTAFAILGVLLLAMSYLYSRFRGSIENWWRPRS
jgi:uncharacterized membrane protein